MNFRRESEKERGRRLWCVGEKAGGEGGQWSEETGSWVEEPRKENRSATGRCEGERWLRSTF